MAIIEVNIELYYYYFYAVLFFKLGCFSGAEILNVMPRLTGLHHTTTWCTNNQITWRTSLLNNCCKLQKRGKEIANKLVAAPSIFS